MEESSGDVPLYQTKSAYAAAKLRQAFSQGEYTPGDRLQAAKLAKDLGLSLTPIREALLELANEGLVNIQPHRGARVADVPITDLTEAYLVRERLESLAAKMAAQQATDDSCEALHNSHVRFVEAAEAGEWEALRRLSDNFHDVLYNMAKSPLLHRLIRNVLESVPSDTFTSINVRAQRTVHYHEKILEAIRLRDEYAAESLMSAHIKDSLELILDAKESPGKQQGHSAIH